MPWTTTTPRVARWTSLSTPCSPPQQNAAKYYRAYNKAKTAQKMLTIQIEKGGGGGWSICPACWRTSPWRRGERDLQEIRQELTETGYLRRQGKSAQRVKTAAGKPMEFRSSTGKRISVGKNNAQNDRLTCKLAYKSDIWLHTQKIHGSHVILWLEGGRGGRPEPHRGGPAGRPGSPQGRELDRVAVDYTPGKICEEAGGGPGRAWWCTPPVRRPWCALTRSLPSD